MRPLPRFLHVLTAIHAVGACACFVMAFGSFASDDFRQALAVSGGSTIMVATFREWTWAFLMFVGAVLATLAYASWRVRPWAWPTALVVYGIGVLGSLRQVSVGISQGWVAAAVNAAVFIYASTPGVRRGYTGADVPHRKSNDDYRRNTRGQRRRGGSVDTASERPEMPRRAPEVRAKLIRWSIRARPAAETESILGDAAGTSDPPVFFESHLATFRHVWSPPP
jgi:hypothetical protein